MAKSHTPLVMICGSEEAGAGDLIGMGDKVVMAVFGGCLVQGTLFQAELGGKI